MLYIVATPIGNLKDMTYRAVEVLKSVDKIACEDTRHSLTLLNHYDIRKPLVAFHKFNTQKAIGQLIGELKEGKNIALISDAGMPCISDPGAELVKAAIREEIEYTVLPGASAFVNAAVLSGYSEGAFAFLGFLPENNAERRELLESYRFTPCPLIFYCSPHAIAEDIAFLRSVYGDRKIAAVKELTKLYEKVEFSTLGAGLSGEIRGEYVLIVEGKERENALLNLNEQDHLKYYTDMGMEKKEAIKQVARDRGVHKSEIYKKFT